MVKTHFYTVLAVLSAAIGVIMLTGCAMSGGTNPTYSGSTVVAGTPIISTPDPQPNSNGAMARANVHGTGVYVTRGVRHLTGLGWKYNAGDAGSITTPVIQGSAVYFSHRGILYAVDAATGTEKWNRNLVEISTSAPAIAGDTLYIGTWERFYALSTETGGLKWIFQPESGSEDRNYIDPVVDDGTVYFGAWHNFYALDSQTGVQKWKIKLSGINISVPTVYGGTIYVGTSNPGVGEPTYLYALDSKTGQEKWKLTATGDGIGGAVAVTDGTVYVSTHDGLLALDARSGREQWRYNTGSTTASAPAVAYGAVYVTNVGTLYAIDAQTGKEKWRLQSGGDLYSDPVIADGIIYFGSVTEDLAAIFAGQSSGELHAVDAQSGQELWKFSVAGAVSSAPAVSDGMVYFGNDAGTLYAVK